MFIQKTSKNHASPCIQCDLISYSDWLLCKRELQQQPHSVNLKKKFSELGLRLSFETKGPPWSSVSLTMINFCVCVKGPYIDYKYRSRVAIENIELLCLSR